MGDKRGALRGVNQEYFGGGQFLQRERGQRGVVAEVVNKRPAAWLKKRPPRNMSTPLTRRGGLDLSGETKRGGHSPP